MPKVTEFHRPTSVDEAVELLSTPGRIAIGGGTVVNTPGGEPVEVVDLSALGFSGIESVGDRIRLGASTVLQDVAESTDVPQLVSEMARRELPSTLRTLATVGGTMAVGDPESLLVAALVAFGAEVEVAGQASKPLSDYLAGPRDGLLTAVLIQGDGVATMSETGRTPADTPIVAAIARRSGDHTTVVLTGVAAWPVEIDPAAPTATIDPAADFRGTRDYRLHLAEVHTSRAIADLG